jgi:hypothetical protein
MIGSGLYLASWFSRMSAGADQEDFYIALLSREHCPFTISSGA